MTIWHDVYVRLCVLERMEGDQNFMKIINENDALDLYLDFQLVSNDGNRTW